MKERYHYKNLGQTITAHPEIAELWRKPWKKLATDILQSQLLGLADPNVDIGIWNDILGIKTPQMLRWNRDEDLAIKDYNDREAHFDTKGDFYMWTVNRLWDDLEYYPEVKQDLFHARNIKPDDQIKNEDIRSHLNSNPSGYHLEKNDADKQKHFETIKQLASSYIQNSGYNEYSAISRAVKSLYGWTIVGRDEDTGSYHGLSTSAAREYDLSPEQIVSGARRRIAETLMNVTNINQLDVLGFKESLTPSQKRTFLEEAFKSRGTVQIDVAPAMDGNGWMTVIKKYKEIENSWWFNDWNPTSIQGLLVVDGKHHVADEKEIQRLALSEEIVVGLQQIYELPGPRLPGGTTIWEDLMTHEKEYLGSGGKPPTKYNISGQQFPATDLMKGFFLGAPLASPQSYSKGQVDFVIKPMIEHFRGNIGERYMPEPSDTEIRAYIDKELKKHGSFRSKFVEYLKGAPFLGSWLDDDFYKGIKDNPQFDPSRSHFLHGGRIIH